MATPPAAESEPVSASTTMLSARTKRVALVLVPVLGIALLLLLAEGATRARQALRYGSASMLEDYWTEDARTGLRIPVAGFSKGRISINSRGFRGPEIAVPKLPGTLRVAFLGASTTWCAEVSGNNYVWPHLVTAALGSAFPNARFDYVNAGVPGYTMRTIRENLVLRVAPLEPDVIVIYEVSNNLSGELREIAAQRGLIESAKVQELTWVSRYSLFAYLVEKNLHVIKARRTAHAGTVRLDIDPDSLGAEFRQDLMQVVRAAQQSARLVALVTFSIHLRPGQSPEQQARASESALFYTPFASADLVMAAYERYNNIVREVARETGALLIEGEADIPGDSVHFTDTVHFTDAGSRFMAERVSRGLAASAELRALMSEVAASR